MRESLKGFIFAGLVMLITPALAIPNQDSGAPPVLPMPELQKQYFQLTYEDAEAAIGVALAERGAGAKIEAILNRTDPGNAIFHHSKAISVEIRGLRYNDNTSRFTASLVALSGDKVISAVAASGRYHELVEIPVLKRNVRADQTIETSDIKIQDYAKARMRSNTITDIASLIGKAPVRTISAGRPIRAHEIQKPNAVKKNDLVKMHYRVYGMQISAQGEAMDDGHQGSIISVRNTSSKRIIQARVENATNVIVTEPETFTSSIDYRGSYDIN